MSTQVSSMLLLLAKATRQQCVWVGIIWASQNSCMNAAWHARMMGAACTGTSAAPPEHPTARRKDHRHLLQQLQEAQAQANAALASSRAEVQVTPITHCYGIHLLAPCPAHLTYIRAELSCWHGARDGVVCSSCQLGQLLGL